MLGSGFGETPAALMRIGVPVGLDVFVDLPLQIDGARRAQRAHDHVGAHAAIGGDIAAGIGEASVGRIVVNRHADLAARGGDDVRIAAVGERGKRTRRHTAANRTALLKRNLRRKFPGEVMGNASAA